MKKITYKYDEETGGIEFFLDGKFFEEFVVEDADFLDATVATFRNIYATGYEDGLTNGDKTK